MPAYVNPYYQNMLNGANGGYMQPNAMPMMQQSYAPIQQNTPMQSNVVGYQVDGEMAAKAYMIPAGTAGPIALWDLNENVFYMRSFNNAGMPNPLKKYRFYEEEISTALPAGQSGAASIDPEKYVTKDDFEDLKQEIRQLSGAVHSMNQSRNQNYGSSGQGPVQSQGQSMPQNSAQNHNPYSNQNGNNTGRTGVNQGRQS